MPSGGRPARACSVCGHPRRAEVDRAILNGEKQADVARRYKMSPDAISRHVRSHLAGALVAGNVAAQPPASDEPGDVVSVMLRTQARLLRVIDRCERLKQTVIMIQAVRELRMTVEAIARLTGATDASGALRRQVPNSGGRSSQEIREGLARKIAALAGDGLPKPAPI